MFWELDVVIIAIVGMAKNILIISISIKKNKYSFNYNIHYFKTNRKCFFIALQRMMEIS